MADGFEAMLAELNAAMEQHVREVVQIRVTDYAPEGSMVNVPLLGEAKEAYERRGYEEPRELLVHPNDWRTILRTLPRQAGMQTMPRAALQPQFVVGLPIVHE